MLGVTLPAVTVDNTIDIAENDIEETSRTWRIDVDGKRIVGMVDGLDAMAQAVYKIVRTERLIYQVYSPAYGVELGDTIGKDKSFVTAVLEERITDALLADDRVLAVRDFAIDATQPEAIAVEFMVETSHGNLSVSEVI